MATFSSRITDKEYVNWLKVGLALNFLREGLKRFVEVEGRAFQSSILAAITGAHSPCQYCSTDDCSRRKRQDVWKFSNKCPNQVCDTFLAEIMKNYVQAKNIPKPCTEPQNWPVDYFSVIQLYFGPGCGNKKSLEDCDCPNFLNLFNNCEWFLCRNTSRNLGLLAQKVLNHRNELMHSTSLKLPTETMEQWLRDMVALLQSLHDFSSKPEAVQASNYINDLLVSNLQITSTDEIHVLQQHTINLQQKINVCGDRVKDLGEDVQKMSKDNSEITNIRDKYKSNFEEIQKLKTVLIGTSNLLDQSPDLQSRMERKFQDIKTDYARLSARLNEAEPKISRCKALKNKLRHLKERMDETEFKSGETDSTVEQLGERIATSETKFARIDSRVTALEEKETGEIQSAVKRLGDRIDTTNSSVKQLGEKLGDRIATSETKFARMDTRVTTLEAKDAGEIETAVIRLGERMHNTDSTVEQLGKKLNTSETNFARINTRVTTLEAKETSEQQMNPRLLRIKENTRSFLKSRNTGGFIRTRQFVEAKKMLDDNGCVLISGKPGEGKTTSAVVMMKDIAEEDRCIKLSKASDWDYVDSSQVDVVFIDDIVGLYKLDAGKLREWLNIFDDVQACIDDKTSNMKLIMCTRSNIISECNCQLERFEMFEKRVNFSSSELSYDEKKQILLCKLKKSNKTLTENELLDCLSEFKCQIGFPYCCHLFTTNIGLFKQKAKYFKKPYLFFIENIKRMDRAQMLAFLCIFYKDGKLEESTFTVEHNTEQLKSIVSKIAEVIGVETEPKLGTIRGTIEHHRGVYIEELHMNLETFYVFAHNVMYETLGLLYGQMCPADAIRYSTLDFLCECIDVDPEKKSEGVLCVKPGQYDVLATRIIHEVVDNGEVFRIANHPVFVNSSFMEVLFRLLEENRLAEKFLLQKDRSKLSKLRQFCLFSEVLEKQLEKAAVFAEKSLQILNVCDLERLFHDAMINNKAVLRTMVKSVSPARPLCLKYAVDCAEHVLSKVLKDLKDTGQFDPDSEHVQAALNRSLKLKGVSVSPIEILLNAISPARPWCLKYAVHCNDDVLCKVVKDLQDTDQLGPFCEKQIQKEMDYSFVSSRIGRIEAMLNVISPARPWCLKYAVDCDVDVLRNVLKDLRDTGQFDPDCEYIQAALNRSLKLKGESVSPIEILLNAISPARSWCLKYAVHCNDDVLCKVLKDLTDTDQLGPQCEKQIQGKMDYNFKSFLVDQNESILSAISPARPWCLKYAIHCCDSVLCKVVTDLQKTGQFDLHCEKQIQEEIDSNFVLSHFIRIEAILSAICPARPWCLTYALHCNDDVLCKVVKDLQGTGKLGEKCEKQIKKEIDSMINCGHSNRIQTLLSAISPARPWCLEYAVYCNDDVLCEIVKDLQGTGKLGEKCEKQIKKEIDSMINCGHSNRIQTLLSAISPARPWCLEYAVYCNDDVLCEIVKDLQGTGKLGEKCEKQIKKEIDSMINCGHSNRIQTLLSAISPARPWCLEYAVYCDDDVLCEIVKDLQDNGQFDPDSEHVQTALNRSLGFEEKYAPLSEIMLNAISPAKTEILLSAISPVRPWCLTYALHCNDNVLCKIVKDLQDTGQFDPDGDIQDQDEIVSILEFGDSIQVQKLLSAISPARPWCLEYAVRCKDADVLHKVVKDLQDTGQFDSESEYIQAAMNTCLMSEDTLQTKIVLNAVCPARRWCLKYAVACDDEEVLCKVVKDLLDNGQFDFDCERQIQEKMDSMLTMWPCKSILSRGGALLRAISPARPWCLKFAVQCGNEVLSKVLKDLQDTGQFDPDSEHVQAALNSSFEFEETSSTKIILNAISPARPWCLKYAVPCDDDDVLSKVLKDLQDTGQFDPDSEHVQAALNMPFWFDKTSSTEIILNAISPARPSCLKYAVQCGDDVLSKVLKDLQDTGQFDPDSEHVQAALNRSLKFEETSSTEIILNVISPARPWCLKYAAECDDAEVISKVVKDLQDTGQFDSDSERQIQQIMDSLLTLAYPSLFASDQKPSSVETLLHAISPARPWCLKYAVHCDDDVLSKVLKGLQDTGQFDPDSEHVQVALNRSLEFVKTSSTVIILNAISPVKPWCLKYAVQCDDDVLSKVLKDLQDTGQFDPDSEHVQAALNIPFWFDKTSSTEIILNAISPARPWCLKYAAHCGDAEVISKVLKDLQDTGQFDPDSEHVQAALNRSLEFEETSSTEIILNAISPARPWCLKYAAECDDAEVISKVVKDLQDTGQFDSDSERQIQQKMDSLLTLAYPSLFASDQKPSSVETLLHAISPARPWCLKYAVHCDDDVLSKVLKDLQDTGQFDPDSEHVQAALNMPLRFDKRSSTEIILNAISPARPWCLKYAVQCDDDVLSKVLKDLQDTGQFDPDSEHVQAALNMPLRFYKRSSTEIILNAISPARPWCLKYAVQCADDVLSKVLKDLQDTGQFDPDSEHVQAALNKPLRFDKRSSTEIILNAISPARPWCLKYVAHCGDAEVISKVVKDLQDTGQFDSDSERQIQQKMDSLLTLAYPSLFASDQKPSSVETLLHAISPARPWCLKYAVHCDDDVLSKVLKDLQDTGQFDPDSEHVQAALNMPLRFDKRSSTEIILNAISPARPWCLKYAVQCADDVLSKVLKDLQDTGQFDPDSEHVQAALNMFLRFYKRSSTEIILNAISPARPWCLKYAVQCADDVLSKVLKDLQDTGQFVPDSEHVQAALNMLLRFDKRSSTEIILNAISPARPWCLKYAVQCADDVLSKVLKDLQDTGQFDPDSEHVQAALNMPLRFDKRSSTEIILNAISPARPWCLKYAVQCADDVLSKVLKDLQDTGQFDPDSEHVQAALNMPFWFDKRSSTEIILNAISPARPSCLKYAVQCGDDGLSKVLKDLQDTGQFDPDSEHVQAALNRSLEFGETSSTEIILNAISTARPWCLKYAVHCSDDILFRVMRDFQEACSEEIQKVLDMCVQYKNKQNNYILKNTMSISLNKITPIRPWCLKYAVNCGIENFCVVLKRLQMSGQFDLESEKYIEKQLHLYLAFENIDAVNKVLSTVSPSQLWCLKYAIHCSADILNRIIQNLKDHGLFEADGKEVKEIFDICVKYSYMGNEYTSAVKDSLQAMDVMKPLCFRSILNCDSTFCKVVKNMNDSGQFGPYDEETLKPFNNSLKYLRNLKTLIRAISDPLRQCHIEYVIQCGEQVLQEAIKKMFGSGSCIGTPEFISDALKKAVDTYPVSVFLQLFDALPESKYPQLHDMLHICLDKGYIECLNIFLRKVKIFDWCCLEEAARSSNVTAMDIVIKALMESDRWNAENEHVHLAVELCLEAGNTEAVETIKRDSAALKPCCLRKACLSGSIITVGMVIDEFKCSNSQALNHRDIHRSLRAASGKGFALIVELLLKETYPPQPCCLKHAINTYKDEFVLEFINQLKSGEGLWYERNVDIHSALHESIQKGNMKMTSLLLKSGVSVADCCLLYAVQSDRKYVLTNTIHELQQSGELDKSHEDIHEAVGLALRTDKQRGSKKRQHFGESILNALQQPQPCCLPLAVVSGSCKVVNTLLAKLKNGDLLANNEHLHTAMELTLSSSEVRKTTDDWWSPSTCRDENEKMTTSFLNFGICFGNCCVKAAVCSGSLPDVKQIVDELKTVGIWDVNNKKIHDAFHLCLCKGYLSLAEFLNKEGLEARTCCLVDAVSSGKETLVDLVIKQLSNKIISMESKEIHVALETVIEAGNLPIIDKLLNVHIRPRPCCMKPVVRSGKEELAVKIIHILKKDGLWNVDHKDIHTVLKLCADSCQLKVLEKILLELLPHKICCFRHGIRTRNEIFIRNMVKEFKDSSQWSPNSMDVHEALEVSLSENNTDVAELLQSEGASVMDCCLWHAVYSEDLPTVKLVITKLKEAGQWNVCHEDIHDALKLSVDDGHVPTTKCILEAFSPVYPCCAELTKSSK